MIRVKEAITAEQQSQRKPPGERAGRCGLVSEHQPCRVSVQGHRSNRRKGEDGTLMARLNVRFWVPAQLVGATQALNLSAGGFRANQGSNLGPTD